MAEQSLDDFFAKKDKKSKKKSKIAEPTIAIQSGTNIDDSDKAKKEKKKREKEKNQTSSSSTPSDVSSAPVKVDDDWTDFEEVKEKDYSGLRIQNLQISNKEDDDDEEEEYVGEDGETKERKGSSQVPWLNKSQHPGKSQKQATAASAPQAPSAFTEEVKAIDAAIKKYVPPGARSGASVSHANPRRKREAPNIKSEHDFPTLGGRSDSGDGHSAAQDVSAYGNRAASTQLKLANKYSALQD